MKQLEKTFVKNCDGYGNHTFTQIRREGIIAAYRRNRVKDGTPVGYEVFLIKTVKAGSPLPGGGMVAESYEQYPGAAAFGRHAWSISWGPSAEARVNRKFEELLKGEIPVVEVEGEETEIEIIPVIRVGKRKDRRPLNLPDYPFSQKELASLNGIENYKEVYTDLQRMKADGTLVLAGQRENLTRGKDIQLFATPVVWSRVKGQKSVEVVAA